MQNFQKVKKSQGNDTMKSWS